MVSSNRRPLRSREERAMDGQRGVDSSEAGDPGVSDGEEVDDVEELRGRARSLGFVVAREARPRAGRPLVDRQGKVRVTTKVSLEVREAMQRVCWDLEMTVSEIMEQGVLMFLESRGLRVGTGFAQPRAESRPREPGG